MQFKKVGKIVAAGTVSMVLAGSSLAFAALDSYPAPFVTSAGVQSLIVVGSQGTDAAGLASDVAGAIDVAARLGGEVTTEVSVQGAVAGISISGEGKDVSTTNKRVYLNDTLSKTGLRNTMTKDDLPALLADGSIVDSDAGTTHKYTQFIKLSPGTAHLNSYRLQFEKPGDSSVSNEDPTYSFGEFSQSPASDEWFYQTQVIFDKEVNGTTAVGEKLNFFGGEYTINSDTTFVAGVTSNKLVLAGGADTAVLLAGESKTVSFDGKTYDVTLIGTSSSTQAVVRVGSDQKTLTKGVQTQVGGLDVYVDDVFHLSTTDLSQNSAKLLLGASKIVLQHGNKVKIGTDETAVQGTFVNLTVSGGKLASFTLYVGGESSSKDFLKLGGSVSDPVWKNFKVAFPSLTEAPTASSRGLTKIEPSGDNLATVTFKDDKGQEKSINWAYKATSSGTSFLLGDSSGDRIYVVEGETVPQNGYIVADAGDFPHMFEMTSLTADFSTSASLDLTDVFSGATTKVNLGADNQDTKVIDGQSYYIYATSAGAKFWWGAGAANNSVGDFTTVYPRLKGQKGEYIAFANSTNPVTITSGGKIQLPTGAVTTTYNGATQDWTLAVAANEDGTSTVGTSLSSTLNLSNGGVDTFTLGKTANGGLVYNITGVTNTTARIGVVGGSGQTQLTQPAIVLIEEEDDNKDRYTVTVSLGTEASGSNQQASINSISFSDGLASEVALGSDSNVNHAADRYGLYSVRSTSSQDKVWLYYPDLQVSANVAVLQKDATTSTGGTTSTTVKQAVPIKTSIAKLDSEVTAADRSNKNLILVGGPAVNSLVAELAAAGKTWGRDQYIAQGAGTSILNLVENAFTTGKSALVVAGHSAADTRASATVLQQFDTHKTELTGKMLAVWKNNVYQSSLSA